jgi:RNA ligase
MKTMTSKNAIHKYPRTPHIAGSGLQPGDDDLAVVPFRALAGCRLLVEEKMDGANSALSFARDGTLLVQSRGHYLTGGPHERQFHLLKAWASRHAAALRAVLGNRYVLYGEWVYAKHTVYYTALAHYFLEFDALDTATGTFLSTPARRTLLAAAPFVVSVPVLHEGPVATLEQLCALLGPSRCITGNHLAHLTHLRAACLQRGLDPGRALRETDPTTLMEGLYIKVEEGGAVRERYKFVRASFLQTVLESGSHWLDRPLLPNGLREGVSLFT